MKNIFDMTAQIKAMASPGANRSGAGTDRLTDLPDFGSNPGALRARTYIPVDLPANAPLVVVLHGCTQTAAGYDHGSGWSRLADRYGFALLFPEQQRGNNANLCFNWFSPEDSRRDAGEALSIRQMIATLVDRHAFDPSRLFVTGLSAGGATASVMLAAYPEVFAGGAIIAGLPFGSAATMMQALDRMRGHGGPDEAGLSALVRGASDHGGPWPKISIWHGTSDATVNEANADAIIEQWRSLHDVDVDPSDSGMIDGYPHRVWLDRSGHAVIEDYRITGMGHGIPLDTGDEDGWGASGAYMLDVHISSTQRIAEFWGLTDAREALPEKPARGEAPRRNEIRQAAPALRAADAPGVSIPTARTDVAKVIENSLRLAGLMR